MANNDRVIRIQADKLAKSIGLPEGTYINEDIIKLIAISNVGDELMIVDHKVMLTPAIKGLAKLLLDKISK